MFCAACYLSVISAFLSVLIAEMSKDGEADQCEKKGGERGEKRGEEDVWTAMKRTANRKCKWMGAPAVVLGLYS